jgi:hypothetical protein
LRDPCVANCKAVIQGWFCLVARFSPPTDADNALTTDSGIIERPEPAGSGRIFDRY